MTPAVGQRSEAAVPSGGQTVTVTPALVPTTLFAPEMNFILHFQRLGPPSYDGRADFMALDDWIISMEEMFIYSGITAEQKVMIAAFKLKGLAKSWYIREKESLAEGCSWESFKKLLLKKFLPSVEQDCLMNEFIHLKQRQMSVVEYEAEFSKLSRFAPEMVSTKEGRVKHFLGGLRCDIQQLASAYRSETYAGVVEAAMKVEAIEIARNRGAMMKKKNKRAADAGNEVTQGPASKKGGLSVCSFCGRPGHPAERCFKRKGAQEQLGVLVIQGAPKGGLVCTSCGRPGHAAAQCWNKSRACFQCGQRGHFKTECLHLRTTLQPVHFRCCRFHSRNPETKGKES